ncbi:MAG TPA: DEAD/DEAH box helicase [Bryobacteraceae bacterium]|jgi:superfamily II DNA or RNA helicase|nr:DEAD/DEAH box helicase [Bryobacteraceae bacterium]
MKLASALSGHFDNDVRARGASYYRLGAVRIKRGNAAEVQAGVRGSRVYDVDISWNGHRLVLFCDCPYYEDVGACKHIWATILAADAQNYFTSITRLNFRDVVFDEAPEAEPNGHHDYDDPLYYAPLTRAAPTLKPQPVAAPPIWRQRLNEIVPAGSLAYQTWPAHRELVYIVDVHSSVTRAALILDLKTREPKLKGGWKKPATPQITRATISKLPNPADRHILGVLSGAATNSDWMAYGTYESFAGFRLRHPVASSVMPEIALTGRCFIEAASGEEWLPLAWDDGPPWRFVLRLQRFEGRAWTLAGYLRRDAEAHEEMELTAPLLISEGLVFTRDRVALLEENAPMEWIAALRRLRHIDAPEGDIGQMLAALLEHPLAARLEVPEELHFEEIHAAPRPCLTFRSERRYEWEQQRLHAELAFDYDGRRVSQQIANRGIYYPDERRFVVRDQEAEAAAKEFLYAQGLEDFPQQYPGEPPGMRLAPKKLPSVAHACLAAGWHVEAEGKIFRRPGAMHVGVSSGVDWFELHGEVEYEGTSVKLPALLAALRRGENMVRLDDGTYGLLPEEWLTRFGPIAGLGTPEPDHLRFRRNQVGLLDALLATQPEVSCDAIFTRVRDELRNFGGIRTGEQPAGFVGQLRDYQRDGVGWMDFLRRFGFGGCLADDMGVGKTAQVLALLEARRAMPDSSGPSLVVVPRSLVFNWKQEAARFTPRLRVLDHTGLARDVNGFDNYDLILTTYGTLRRDAADFQNIEFDYIVLDEAQAIKNPGTESAKAARLLRGRNRLALSGTPVENHLGELWSIFEFLNPGMLGAASVFKLAGGAASNPSQETRALLAQALRPFILRRTKEQVARELPPKSEQTIFCELETPQRKLYDELRVHYRNSLLGMVDTKGLAKSKIQVLEALLRLRQAACHPALIDPKRRHDASAKLDVLIDRLQEVVSEGHKALVFSQFTSLLALVRERLDDTGMVYEYLDGSTRDRQQRVERFQNDPDCGLFLISLKAGGLGLNLTAAEYVFLLDPWWNPAVEAQAVDRAHRIGQANQVFAYRLIARDTVEEKILQLQSTKRDLAAAIISADNSLIRDLKREDLELLLS